MKSLLINLSRYILREELSSLRGQIIALEQQVEALNKIIDSQIEENHTTPTKQEENMKEVLSSPVNIRRTWSDVRRQLENRRAVQKPGLNEERLK